MTFVELVQLIADRKEKVLIERAHIIQTDKFAYYRIADGSWEQKELPTPIVEVSKFQPLPVEIPVRKTK